MQSLGREGAPEDARGRAWSPRRELHRCLRERGDYGRPDRKRHSRRNLIDSQTTPCTNTAETAARLKRHFAAEEWVKPTEATGVVEEAHRRWPKGRSEQGARKAKVDPPRVSRCRAVARYS